jgi:protein gp37
VKQLDLAPPAIVRDAEDLAALAKTANAAHEASVTAEGASFEKAKEALEQRRIAGEALIRAKARLAKDNNDSSHGKWGAWIKKNLTYTHWTACNYMKTAREWEAKFVTITNLDAAARWMAEEAEAEAEEEPSAYSTLEQWEQLSAKEKRELLNTKGDSKFNAQNDNENIEWALWSWNPVSGCLHNCPYCYARDIANRFYDQKFAPSLWPARLAAPQNTSFPEAKIVEETNAVRQLGLRNVFTCSMADLFGRWVPKEWIDAVLAAAAAAPRWNFLFLTKFPTRLAEFEFPPNAWVGTSVDCQARVKNAEKAFRKVKASVKWLSCEPLIEALHFTDIGAFDWIVLGGASESTQTPEWKPPRAWVQTIEAEAEKAGVKVYEKTNLLGRRRQYPGLDVNDPTEAPPELQYLPKDRGDG